MRHQSPVLASSTATTNKSGWTSVTARASSVYKTPRNRSASRAIHSPPIHSSGGFSQSGASCT